MSIKYIRALNSKWITHSCLSIIRVKSLLFPLFHIFMILLNKENIEEKKQLPKVDREKIAEQYKSSAKSSCQINFQNV